MNNPFNNKTKEIDKYNISYCRNNKKIWARLSLSRQAKPN